ncbi:CotS family spore coat protein [Anaerosolibacter carboniphilus]|uniref:CotS family spore coat protein n=1 Tax=Anaerosolibacter carboniphilus TaxID=1417629 RepID=A0A841KTR0_9FIRM|nr:CotS family spore coat protein [Anaerosolibacter carboniphilus]MBB6215548.1 CotS family spore coat protein [Anaerosolibacter carboniphilus]
MDAKLKEIVRRFSLRVNSIIPLRAVYLVDTNEGRFCLKKINYKEDKLLFLYNVKEYLAQNGFEYTDRYRLAHQSPFVKNRNDLYIMTRWIDGRECDFHNPIEVKAAAKNLGRLHIASKGFTAPETGKVKSDLGKWTKTYLQRCEDLIVIKNLVKMKSAKDTVDMLFLRNVDMCYRMGVNAIQMLQSHGYDQQVELEGKERYLCHHDYTYHNIILDPKGEQHLIDFDYCKHELRCYDLAHFIMRNMRRFYWDFDMALELIEAYNQIRSVSDMELKLMVSLFQFPQKLWRVCNRYYYEKYDWSEEVFLKHLTEAIDDLPFQIDFLEKYHKKFL